jgi:hypothetical protein
LSEFLYNKFPSVVGEPISRCLAQHQQLPGPLEANQKLNDTKPKITTSFSPILSKLKPLPLLEFFSNKFPSVVIDPFPDASRNANNGRAAV